MWAAYKGYTTIVKLLLDKGANVNLQDEYGYAVLMWAASFGHKAIVELLLDKGADPNSKCNFFGHNALVMAYHFKRNMEIVNLLLTKGVVIDSLDSYSAEDTQSLIAYCVFREKELLENEDVRNYLRNNSQNDTYAIVEKFKNILKRDDTFTKPRALEKYLENNKGVIPEPLRERLLEKVDDRNEKLNALKLSAYSAYAANNPRINIKINGEERPLCKYKALPVNIIYEILEKLGVQDTERFKEAFEK